MTATALPLRVMVISSSVLISHEDFERWKETAEIMADPEFVAGIRKGMSELKKGRGRRFDTAALDRLLGTTRGHAPAAGPRVYRAMRTTIDIAAIGPRSSIYLDAARLTRRERTKR